MSQPEAPVAWPPHGTALTRPGAHYFDITAGAGLLEHEIRGIYLAVAGDITVVSPHGETVTFTNLAAGIIHPIGASRVTTIVTASGVIGVY